MWIWRALDLLINLGDLDSQVQTKSLLKLMQEREKPPQITKSIIKYNQSTLDYI